jgi:4'-phosphopantetheinyl transferase
MPSDKQELLSGSHLWSSPVDACPELEEAQQTLSPEERTRAGRFHFEQDRVRFVARRAFLRSVLASYVGIEPGKIRLRTSRFGRPELDPHCGIFFNASHSEGLAIVAVAVGRPVGVDIERIRPIADALEMADRFFTRTEVELLRSTPEACRAEVFLTIWTRKESYAKAMGVGLSMPFDRFDVSSLPEERAGGPREPSGQPRFDLTSVGEFDGYIGALALADATTAAHVTVPATP